MIKDYNLILPYKMGVLNSLWNVKYLLNYHSSVSCTYPLTHSFDSLIPVDGPKRDKLICDINILCWSFR